MSKILIVCAFLLQVLTSSVKADPIVVTSGSLTVTGFAGAPHFSPVRRRRSLISALNTPNAFPNFSPVRRRRPLISALYAEGVR